MSRVIIRALSGLMLFASLFVPLTASAHEEVESGNYILTIGWVNEPVIVGQPNGLDLFIQPKEAQAEGEGEGEEDHHAAEGVTGAESTLQFAVEYGDVRKEYAIRPKFEEPGWYTTDFIPTRAGQYTFHFTGSINGEAVDVSFEPEEIETAEAYAFPEAQASVTDLSSQLASAQAQARTAQTIAIVGVVLGLIGTGIGVYGMTRKQ